MREYSLEHELTSVLKNGHISYGGSQKLSENKVIQSSGCGLVAACDLLLYMHRYTDGCSSAVFDAVPCFDALDMYTYNRLLNSLRVYFPLIPNYGINGLMLSAGINAFFIRYSYPFKAVWGVRGDKLWERAEAMLSRDIPVIISVGPNLSLTRQKYRADMYAGKTEDIIRPSARVCAHYMTLTALDEQWLTLSSWGRKYYIRRSDYRIYVKHHSSSVLSNIVYITRK